MHEKYKKKQTYEFCNIRKMMVKLDVIQATVRMPDWAQAEVKLVPVACNQQNDCKKRGIKCIVYDQDGTDPCPEAWKGE